MLTNNCKVACFHLQNVSYYENTANATKGEGLVHEIQIEKYVVCTFLNGCASHFIESIIVFQTEN